MTIKVYVSGICGSQDVRKRQQRVLFILQTMPIDLEIIDVTEPGREDDRIFMQEEVKKHDKNVVLPPQIFNDNEYCGDYADFQLANDDDEVMRFLKLEKGERTESTGSTTQNGIKTERNDNAKEEVKVIDTTGEILNSPEDENVVIDDGANTVDSDVEMQNLTSNEDVEALNDESKVTNTRGKNQSSDEESEEESE